MCYRALNAAGHPVETSVSTLRLIKKPASAGFFGGSVSKDLRYQLFAESAIFHGLNDIFNKSQLPIFSSCSPGEIGIARKSY